MDYIVHEILQARILEWVVFSFSSFKFQLFYLRMFIGFKGIRSRADFPGGSVGKKPSANARDADSIPGSRRSPGGGNGNPL